jgi:Holliday junction DNA helicase RuvA subunit
MIAFLRGVLDEKQLTYIVLDVGGVGYEVMIPLSTYDTLPPVGSEYRCLIFEHIREDAHLLFGFSTEAEREFFKLLLTVSGVGPKIAIGALGGMTISELRSAIVAKDSKRISKLPGIGKKMAERIVVETDGENPQHSGVLNAFAGNILRGEPLVADGREGINGLTISNAMHLSAWTGGEVKIPFDEDLYYEELMKRVATSRRKVEVSAQVGDTEGTY